MSVDRPHDELRPVERRIDLRPFTTDDGALDRRIVAATLTAEIAMLGWSERATEAFIGQQYQARMDADRSAYPGFEHLVISVDGSDVGRLLVHRSAAATAVLDIALLPECRGHGIGTAVLQRVIDSSGGTRVTVEVELSNPAQRLLRRLGFVEYEVRGLHRRLRTAPPTAAPVD